MSAFVGGCSPEAVQAVCAGALDRVAETQLAAGSLVSKSLLREGTSTDGSPRYVMLESIREYAQEKLEASGEAAAIREGHARFYAALAEAARLKLAGPEQVQGLRHLEQEHDNFRAALAWSTKRGAGSAEIALRLSGALGKFWDMHGHAAEGRRWLRAALALGPLAEGSPGRGCAAAAAAALRLKAHVAAGGLATVQGDHPDARAAYLEALRLSQQAGDADYIAVCLMNLGNNACHLGDYAQARLFYERALALQREQGDQRRVAVTLLNMGYAAMSTGEYAAARAYLEESLGLRRERGDRFGAALVIGNLAVVAAEQGEPEDARALLQESLALRQELGDERGIAFCLTRLAALERDQFRYAEAVELYGQGLALYQKVGDQEALAAGLEGLGETLASLGETARAVRLWALADAIRDACHAPIVPAHRARHEQALQQARAALGEKAFEHAWAEGQAASARGAFEGAAAELRALHHEH
jgi:tetratricopeptide (TPR) repeat protein